MVFKKRLVNISYKFRDVARDSIINKLFDYYHITNGAILYSLLTTNPIDVVIGIISAKFGISKIIVTLILAFLL